MNAGTPAAAMTGYRRPDGRLGIRNHVAVVYTVECARHVAALIARSVPGTQVFGFAGCYSDPYAFRMLVELGAHPNLGGLLLVSLGCESTNVGQLAEEIRDRGQRVAVLEIQATGGTLKTVEAGTQAVRGLLAAAQAVPMAEVGLSELTVGVECGGSDATSGLAANPATGWAVDRVVEAGGTAIFSEIPELLGCDDILFARARDELTRDAIRGALRRAEALGNRLQAFAISSGNQSGGLTTIEEKSLGALAKSGTLPIDGVIRTGERPNRPGLYLLDKVGDVTGTISHYEENDNDGLVTLLAAGAQLIVFTTGRGSVVGSALAPVIKVCGNPRTSVRMADNIDVDAGPIIEGRMTVAAAGARVLAAVEAVAAGKRTSAEVLGHEEYWIPYKPGRACDVS
jgi:altronate dehydratase large subunit